MQFRVGVYEGLVAPSCQQRLIIVLDEIKAAGREPEEFPNAIDRLVADISRGAVIPDMTDLPTYANFYAITLHGYRLLLEIDQNSFIVKVRDID